MAAAGLALELVSTSRRRRWARIRGARGARRRGWRRSCLDLEFGRDLAGGASTTSRSAIGADSQYLARVPEDSADTLVVTPGDDQRARRPAGEAEAAMLGACVTASRRPPLPGRMWCPRGRSRAATSSGTYMAPGAAGDEETHHHRPRRLRSEAHRSRAGRDAVGGRSRPRHAPDAWCWRLDGRLPQRSGPHGPRRGDLQVVVVDSVLMGRARVVHVDDARSNSMDHAWRRRPITSLVSAARPASSGTEIVAAMGALLVARRQRPRVPGWLALRRPGRGVADVRFDRCVLDSGSSADPRHRPTTRGSVEDGCSPASRSSSRAARASWPWTRSSSPPSVGHRLAALRARRRRGGSSGTGDDVTLRAHGQCRGGRTVHFPRVERLDAASNRVPMALAPIGASLSCGRLAGEWDGSPRRRLPRALDAVARTRGVTAAMRSSPITTDPTTSCGPR